MEEAPTNYTLTSTATSRLAISDEDVSYATISSAPPKRRAGRTKFQETRHPTFKGVRRRNSDRWVCEVREPNKKSRIWLGTFPTAEMAARAHDVAAIALRGRSACLNFADSAWLLPVPESKSPRDIQRAAALAAESFRPQQSADMMRRPSVANDGRPGQGEISSASKSDGFLFVDEMQGYFHDMAQGMLIEPPPIMAVPDDFDGESDGGMSLWSFSI